MASTFSRATAAVNAEAAAVCALLNGGKLCIYGGTQPARADILVSGQPCLVEIALPVVAFQAPDLGRAVAYPMAPAVSDTAARKATWFRAYMADGITSVFDGSVGRIGGADDADFVIDEIVIGEGFQVQVIQLVYQAVR